MKTMKNKITVFLAAFLMCVVFVPAVKAKAASLYAGGAVTGLTQTDIKSDSATIQWNAAQGAKGYLIYGYALGSYYLVSETTNTSISLPGSNIVDQQIVVVPYDAESQEHISDAGCWGWITISTLPKKVTGVKYYKPYASSNELSVIWDDEACLGFEAICYDKNGKKVIQKIDTTTYHSADFSKANTQNIYQVKIKPYVVINGNQKVYGPTSSTFYAVPQPKITSTNSDVHKNSVKLKWKKVKGASKYIIYVSKSKTSGYKKVATVKGSKSSYVVTNLNTINNTYYFKIVTTGKFGKKNKVSQKNSQLSAHSYYR